MTSSVLGAAIVGILIYALPLSHNFAAYLAIYSTGKIASCLVTGGVCLFCSSLSCLKPPTPLFEANS